jgi:hypothetical protein
MIRKNTTDFAIGCNIAAEIQFQIYSKPSGLSWLPEEGKANKQLFMSSFAINENGQLFKQEIPLQNIKFGGKRKPVKTKVKKQFALPKLVKDWVDENFVGEKSRETAYLFAYSAHLQVQNRYKWGSDFICLPASTLKKYITDKNLSKIKSVFEKGKIVFKEGKKKTINNKLMDVYDFNRTMFLESELVVVSVNKFIEKDGDEVKNDKLTNSIPIPLSSGEEGDDINLVYMLRNLPLSAQFTSSTTQNSLHEVTCQENLPKSSEIAHPGIISPCEIAHPVKPEKEIAHVAQSMQIEIAQPAISQPQIAHEEKTPQSEIAHAVLNRPSPFPKINKLKFPAEEIYEFAKRNLQQLKIDLDKLRKMIPDHVEKSVGKIEVITTNHPDKVAGYKYLGGTDKIYYNKIHSIISKLKHGQSLMKYKEDWIVGSYQQYVELKRKQIKESLFLNIQSLSNPECFSSFLSDTNGRLFHNLSNVWGGFREQILLDNNLVEIDMANSQMAFLAKELMQQPNYVFGNPDVGDFVSDAEDGVLYERIARKMDTTKDFAKQITFNIIFNPSTKMNELAKGFEKYYPNVYQYCKEFKKIYGGNGLAIYLQKLESDVMIKLIYNLLMENKIFSLTMHDSVICRADDLELVEGIMRKAFYDITLHAKLRVKNPAKPKLINNTAPVLNADNICNNQNITNEVEVGEGEGNITGENFGRVSTETGTDYFGSCAKKNKEPKPLTKDEMEWAASLNWDEILADEIEPVQSKAEELIEQAPPFTADMFEDFE